MLHGGHRGWVVAVWHDLLTDKPLHGEPGALAARAAEDVGVVEAAEPDEVFGVDLQAVVHVVGVGLAGGGWCAVLRVSAAACQRGD